MNIASIVRRLTGVILGTWLTYSQITPTTASEHRECVGRYELTLPDDFEVATTRLKIREKYVEHTTEFPDGEIAPLSSFIANGDFQITRGLSKSDYERIMSDVRAGLREYDDYVRLSNVRTGRMDTVAFLGSRSGEFYLYKGDFFVSFHTADFSTATGEDAAKNVNAQLMSTLSGLKFREIGSVPREAGDCLPYLFIRKERIDARKIGVTFRLERHPDVTIFILDDASRAKANLTSRQKNEFAWKYSGLGVQVELDHEPVPFHTVDLDGRNGVSSFGTITRNDGTTDYGYLATVQGDPNAPLDTPDLMLLVQRTAKYAKGNPPISPEELKRMAKDIAASVKRRPVQ
ncbi:hypothetical protein AWB75_05335 [Caballeronia catudaia]|uniref:Uncharacterized protein n=1 Tax=Caballeronia catudaia TaxID=1777136 RepID=A0A158CM45_9BURK|nr:hypothetical protein [Caballeronia catudaia]SAK82936.1 hypothetical protein AWB75_05335 [Caballeronia catudaia]